MAVVQIGFNDKIYKASEGEGVVNITVSILNGMLSQELEITVGIVTLDGTATSKAVAIRAYIAQ